MILVTGSTGLVGSHLLYHLSLKNDAIIAMYRTEKKIEKVRNVFSYYTNDFEQFFSKIKWVQADITDVPSLEVVFQYNILQVYHCAALVSFDPRDYHEMRRVNIEGTANLVNFSTTQQVQKFCFVSSIAAVGDAINGEMIDEENDWTDNGDKHGYAITKYGAEMEVWRGSQEGLAVVIVNPGVILGSGFFNEGSGKIFSQVYSGFKFYTEGVTGFVGVKDVVNIMSQLMNSKIINERFILISENKSFRYIFNNIADAFNLKRPSIKIGTFATAIFWRIDWLLTKLTGKTPLLTKNSARSSHNKEFYSTEKIRTTLNFEFQNIETTIKDVCNDFKKGY